METHPNQSPEPERAFDVLAEGLGRRDLLKATALVGAGAVAPAWLASPGIAGAAADPDDAEPPALQPGGGGIRGRYLASTPDTVMWGYLPNRDTEPVMSVDSGTVVTIDTVSHEGILEDQGRDPVRYFAQHGVPARG